MSGNHSRRKGAGFERELVNFMRDGGLDAMRVPLSGATDFQKGDVVITTPYERYVGELKRRKCLPDWIVNALGEHSFLAMREDRGKTLIVITAELFRDLLR
jgi:Holliday junction resolvase